MGRIRITSIYKWAGWDSVFHYFGWKGLPRTNTLTYWASWFTKKMKCREYGPWCFGYTFLLLNSYLTTLMKHKKFSFKSSCSCWLVFVFHIDGTASPPILLAKRAGCQFCLSLWWLMLGINICTLLRLLESINLSGYNAVMLIWGCLFGATTINITTLGHHGKCHIF